MAAVSARISSGQVKLSVFSVGVTAKSIKLGSNSTKDLKTIL